MSGASRKFLSTLLVPTTAIATLKVASTQTESASKPQVSLKTRMTAIGHFSLKTETNTHPSVPTFFLALSNPKSPALFNCSMTTGEFERLWKKKDMPIKHPRFHKKVSESEGYFEPVEEELSTHITETLHMNVYRLDLKRRIEDLVSNVMDVKKKLWEVQISNGDLGSSGAISQRKCEEIRSSGLYSDKETVLLFRSHHSLGDAVSLIAALSDLLDEADEIKGSIDEELRRRKNSKEKRTFLQKLKLFLQRLIWLVFGSLKALTNQAYLQLSTRLNPFLLALNMSEEEARKFSPGRSVSWCDVAPISEVKDVAKTIGGSKATINDVFVSCVSAAVSRQLKELQMIHNTGVVRKYSQQNINVVIPVHLAGGIIPPGRGIGNLIGAFVSKIPCDLPHDSSAKRFLSVHNSLLSCKSSPAPFLGYMMAKVISKFLPESIAVRIFKASSANAAVAITNSRGFEEKVHIDGRRVESIAGFLPLPPGLPVGVVIGSYGGEIHLSVNAETWAVPDSDKFLGWILDEYKRLRNEAATINTKS